MLLVTSNVIVPPFPLPAPLALNVRGALKFIVPPVMLMVPPLPLTAASTARVDPVMSTVPPIKITVPPAPLVLLSVMVPGDRMPAVVAEMVAPLALIYVNRTRTVIWWGCSKLPAVLPRKLLPGMKIRGRLQIRPHWGLYWV